MAKKKQSRSPRSNTSTTAPKSSGYTTRLSPEQGRFVEEAARVLNMTPAKFIRDAALRRALEVVNSQGGNAVALRRIAEGLSDRVRNPTVRLLLEAPDGTRFEREITKREFEAFLPDDEPENIARAASYWYYENGPGAERFAGSNQSSYDLAVSTKLIDVAFPNYPTDDEIRRFRNVYDQTGSELIELFMRQLEIGFQKDAEFIPQIDPARLMAGDDAAGD